MPRYSVQVLDCTSTFGPNNIQVVWARAKNIGIAGYINDIPEAFFTVNQDDPQLPSLLTIDPAHVRIYRDDTLVFAGWLSQYVADGTDIIFYAYGYISTFYTLLSNWNITYTNSLISTIINTEWTYIGTKLHPRTGWMTKGTIQDPVTTTGGPTALVLPTYTLLNKRYLMMLQELAVLGRADTANTVQFEVTTGGVLNFWKDKSSAISGRPWSYDGKRIVDFQETFSPMFRRNSIVANASNPANTLLRTSAVNTADAATHGLLQEPLALTWVRDSTQFNNAVKSRLARSVRQNVDISVVFGPNQMSIPPVSDWSLGDTVTISLSRGITKISEAQQVQAYQMLYVRNRENVLVKLADKPGV